MELEGQRMSEKVWIRHLSPHMRALARLAKPRRGKAWLA